MASGTRLCSIIIDLDVKKAIPINRCITSRNLKGIDIDKLRSDLRAIHTDDINLYNNELKALVDKHAPLVTRGESYRPYAPWYDTDVKSAKCECRREERLWLKTGLTIHKECFLIKKQQWKLALKTAKMNYYMSKFSRSKQSSLPSIYEDSALPNMFAVYFSEKVQNLRDNLDGIDICQKLP